MLRLDPNQCSDWLATHGFMEEEEGHHFFPKEGSGFVVDFSQPASSRGIAVLARHMSTAAGEGGGDSLLLLNDWGVWPTEESFPLFERAMIGYGDPRTIAEAPGFVFNAAEGEDRAALVRFALICGWSGGLLSATSPVSFALTDDEWLSVFGRSERKVRQWVGQQFFTDFELKVIWEGKV